MHSCRATLRFVWRQAMLVMLTCLLGIAAQV